MFVDFFPFNSKVFFTTTFSSIVPGIRVILDLTPNYKGQDSWFLPTEIDAVAAKMKVSVLVLTAGGSLMLGLC